MSGTVDTASGLFLCSFCHSHGDVLVVGPGVNICSECVEAAVNAIAEVRAARDAKQEPTP